MYTGVDNRPTLNAKTIAIKHLRQSSKREQTQDIYPLKQSLEEYKLQVRDRIFTSFKISGIPLPPNVPHETMGDQAPYCNITTSAKLKLPTCQKLQTPKRENTILQRYQAIG